MNFSSEYDFPIFISSTEYDLKDLKAELGQYLSELGCSPKVSSAEGFPDECLERHPWEACLPVIDKCFIVALVIDGRYGRAFDWPKYQKEIGNRKVSPTHGEYLYSRQKEKRMYVYIRKQTMSYYQVYRAAIKKHAGDKEKAKRNLNLPDFIEVEALDFVHEIKTAQRVWISEFDNVVDLKRSFRKKLINELARAFLQDDPLEQAIDIINKCLPGMSPEKRKEVFGKIPEVSQVAENLEKLKKLNKELDEKHKELQESSGRKEKELREKIQTLETEKQGCEAALEQVNSQLYLDNGKIKSGNFYTTAIPSHGTPWSSTLNTCPQCGRMVENNACDDCGVCFG